MHTDHAQQPSAAPAALPVSEGVQVSRGQSGYRRLRLLNLRRFNAGASLLGLYFQRSQAGQGGTGAHGWPAGLTIT